MIFVSGTAEEFNTMIDNRRHAVQSGAQRGLLVTDHMKYAGGRYPEPEDVSDQGMVAPKFVPGDDHDEQGD